MATCVSGCGVCTECRAASHATRHSVHTVLRRMWNPKKKNCQLKKITDRHLHCVFFPVLYFLGDSWRKYWLVEENNTHVVLNRYPTQIVFDLTARCCRAVGRFSCRWEGRLKLMRGIQYVMQWTEVKCLRSRTIVQARRRKVAVHKITEYLETCRTGIILAYALVGISCFFCAVLWNVIIQL